MTLFTGACTALNSAYEDSANESGATGKQEPPAPSSTRAETFETASTSGDTTSGPQSTDGPQTTQGPTTMGPTDTTDEPVPACGVPTDDCGSFDADACPPGERCVPWGTVDAPEGVGCVPLIANPPPRNLGEPCDRLCPGRPDVVGVDGCPVGSVCDPFGGDPTCVSLCGDRDPSGCGQQSVCVTYPTSRGEDIGLCRACDPTLSEDNGCDAGQTCVVVGDTVRCEQAGTSSVDETCKVLTDCAPGLACVAGLLSDCTGGCCTPYCTIGGDSCGELKCISLPGGIGIGFCGQPQ